MSYSSSRRRTTGRSSGKTVEIKTFPQAVRYLTERTDYERSRIVRYNEQTFKLDRMKTLLKHLGNPHQQVRFVHVAGTVGKGSTVMMIASMLQGCGYAVGQYTSPHLVDVRERICINNQPISRPDFIDVMRTTAKAAATMNAEPTFFEIMTAAAFLHFAEQAVDIAVVEVGLGGRLDSTNVITPEVSVITRIDYDHTHILGASLKDIAREKAGILKKGVPAVTVEQHEEVEKILRDTAEKVGTDIKVVNKDIEFSYRFGTTDELGPHIRVCLITETSQFMHLPSPLPGEHQAINCGLALAAVDLLKQCGFSCEEVDIHTGLSRTRTPGRMELAWTTPRIVLDGAHNPCSVAALMRCVGAYVPYDSMVCVFGCCEDKDVSNLLDNLALGGDKVIFTRAKGNPRAADPEELQRLFNERSGKMSQVAPTLADALNLAGRAVGRDDLICVTGSFYLVGEAMKYLAELEKKRAQPRPA